MKPIKPDHEISTELALHIACFAKEGVGMDDIDRASMCSWLVALTAFVADVHELEMFYAMRVDEIEKLKARIELLTRAA